MILEGEDPIPTLPKGGGTDEYEDGNRIKNEDGSYNIMVASVFIFVSIPPPPFGRVGVGAYILLFITMSSPLVMLSRHSGCSFTNDSMWRTRLLSNISSTAMRMPVSSTSPKP